MIWALGAQAILSISRLLTTMTVGGRFGPGSKSEVGFYSNAFMVLMLIVGLHEALVTTPLTVFNHRTPLDQKKQFAGSMLIASLMVIGLATTTLGLALIVLSRFQWLDPSLSSALIVVTALAPFQLIREFSRRWLLANLQVRSSAFLEIMFALTYLASLATLVSIGRVSATSAFVVLGCVNVVCAAVWWKIYRAHFSFAATAAKTSLKRSLRYGRWLAGENICATLMMYLCSTILLFQLDEGTAGVFFACLTIVMLSNPFMLGVASLLGPRAAQEFATGGWPALNRIILQYAGFVLIVLLGFATVLNLFGDRITELFFPGYFAGGGKNVITATLAWAMPCLGLSIVFSIGLQVAHRPQDCFIAAVVGLLALLIANFSFSEITLHSAAISFVVSAMCTTLTRLVFLLLASSRARTLQTPTANELMQ